MIARVILARSSSRSSARLCSVHRCAQQSYHGITRSLFFPPASVQAPIHHFSTSSAAMSQPQSLLSTHRLQGKVVVITGASGGIGRATAVLFARAGASVILSARRKDVLTQAVEECKEAAKSAGHTDTSFAASVTDMRDPKSIDALMTDMPAWAKGKVDIFVSNAGLVRGREKVGDIELSEIDEMLETNVRGFIHVNQLFVREFKKRNSGHIITLGSIAGREAYPGGSIYCATKFAVAAFTSSLLKELVDTQIRVTEIQPGMVETDFSVTRFRGDKSAADNEYKGLTPLTPQDIAEDIVFAASRPAHVNVAQSLVFPVNQASPYHAFRGNN